MKYVSRAIAAALLNRLDSDYSFYAPSNSKYVAANHRGRCYPLYSMNQQREELNWLLNPIGFRVHGIDGHWGHFNIVRENGKFDPPLTIEIAEELIRPVIGDVGEIFTIQHPYANSRWANFVALRVNDSQITDEFTAAMNKLPKLENGGFYVCDRKRGEHMGQKQTIFILDQPGGLVSVPLNPFTKTHKSYLASKEYQQRRKQEETRPFLWNLFKNLF